MDSVEFERLVIEIVRNHAEYSREMKVSQDVQIDEMPVEGTFTFIKAMDAKVKTQKELKQDHFNRAQNIAVSIETACKQIAYEIPMDIWVIIHDWSIQRVNAGRTAQIVICQTKNRSSVSTEVPINQVYLIKP